MSPNRVEGDRTVVGLPTEEAVEAVVAADPTRDPDEVRSLLDHVTEDGRVTRDGIDATVSDVAKRLATAETRVELARSALDDASRAAAGVRELDVVASRLEGYRATLDAVTTRVERLGAELRETSTPADRPDAVYESVVELRRIAIEIREPQRRADDLQLDLEEFGRWLGSHERRRRAFAEDVDAVADSLEAARGDRDDAESWLDASLQAALVPVLIADLRAELADLREMAERDGVADGKWAEELEGRLDALESRAESVRDTLDEAGTPAWAEAHGDRIDAFARSLDGVEPPVDWGAVRSDLERARALDEPYP
ncbi:halo transducer protein [Halobellus limi]|uniref:Halo transducer protein n=1 Tax=Halobellus limi TaxID=699433 RepID=A0A1H5UGK8_9EURY|nr:halo transducer protein [Halobellus limi]SEF73407.1 hypothetical protein SAMN04488133_0573 [Halobellus limi]